MPIHFRAAGRAIAGAALLGAVLSGCGTILTDTPGELTTEAGLAKKWVRNLPLEAARKRIVSGLSCSRNYGSHELVEIVDRPNRRVEQRLRINTLGKRRYYMIIRLQALGERNTLISLFTKQIGNKDQAQRRIDGWISSQEGCLSDSSLSLGTPGAAVP